MLALLVPGVGMGGGGGAVVVETPVQTGGGADKSDLFTFRNVRGIPADDDMVMMAVIKSWLEIRRRKG